MESYADHWSGMQDPSARVERMVDGMKILRLQNREVGQNCKTHGPPVDSWQSRAFAQTERVNSAGASLGPRPVDGMTAGCNFDLLPKSGGFIQSIVCFVSCFQRAGLFF